jgi:multisite-specific tRNA:(cytosine-C5)-methyltransferase
VHSISDNTTQKGKVKKRSNDHERTDLLEKIDMTNDRFFAYYKAQNIVPPEEWDQFTQCLQQHLPTTFRLTGSRRCVYYSLPSSQLQSFGFIRIARGLNQLIQEVHVPTLSDVTFEDHKIPPPIQIPWYYPFQQFQHK